MSAPHDERSQADACYLRHGQDVLWTMLAKGPASLHSSSTTQRQRTRMWRWNVGPNPAICSVAALWCQKCRVETFSWERGRQRSGKQWEKCFSCSKRVKKSTAENEIHASQIHVSAGFLFSVGSQISPYYFKHAYTLTFGSQKDPNGKYSRYLN